MKLFLDTSSLFKLYHQEDGSNELDAVFSTEQITHVFLSELTKVEFASAIWKKVRTKEITEEQAKTTIQLFETDYSKFVFLAIDSLITEQAKNLVNKYGVLGLRTLDSIQLSSCIELKADVDLFFTSDLLLKSLMIKEGLSAK